MDRDEKVVPADTSPTPAPAGGPGSSAGSAREQTVNDSTTSQPSEAARDATAEPAADAAQTSTDTAAEQSPAADQAGNQAEAAQQAEEAEAAEVVAGESADGAVTAEPAPAASGAELAALRAELDERTSDLQRVTAEYANYRKRVERDRLVVAEQATAQVVSALLPVLDDLDRAREHGDLVGPFGLVAEQLTTALAKFGLTGFGEVGDAFDPTRHEAVMHQTSADVTEPTCVTVMRRGYLLGERLLRPALVGVADPESQ